MITATPAKQTRTPSTSQRSGRKPSAAMPQASEAMTTVSIGDAAFDLVQVGGGPRSQVGLDVRAGAGGPHREQFGDLFQR